MDPLIKMAIIHYQFESIHPFYDGNGRTGRILNVLYLIIKGLLDLPVLYLSSYIIGQKTKYYNRLSLVRDQNAWEEWILYMLDSVQATANDTITIIKKIRDLLGETGDKVRLELPKIYSKELIEVLFQQPYCKVKYLVDNKIVERQQASVYLKQLEQIGILRGEKVGRENLFINIRLYDLFRSND